MPEKILVDTDVLIDFLRGYQDAVDYITDNADDIVISAISAAELHAGVKGEKEKVELDSFLELFPILPVDGKVAEKGGGYKREYFKSHRIGLADALIAATSDSKKIPLITLNCKHFPMYKNLQPPYCK